MRVFNRLKKVVDSQFDWLFFFFTGTKSAICSLAAGDRVCFEEGAVVGLEPRPAVYLPRPDPRGDTAPRAGEEARADEGTAAHDATHRTAASRRVGQRTGMDAVPSQSGSRWLAKLCSPAAVTIYARRYIGPYS